MTREENFEERTSLNVPRENFEEREPLNVPPNYGR